MNKDKLHDIYKKLLQEDKLRNTPERIEVLDAAIDYKRHFTADELYLSMKNKKSNVSRATVYNTLDLLEKFRVLRTRHFHDNKRTYEVIVEDDFHEHIVCLDCARIEEFSTKDIKEFALKICEEKNFEYIEHSFYIFAKCKDSSKCKRKSK
ncbi:MAG: transcriptional repressor [Ignavibacteriales bacterium]|nr:transcriptional repressor [Ignavibacteriales bacterium]